MLYEILTYTLYCGQNNKCYAGLTSHKEHEERREKLIDQIYYIPRDTKIHQRSPSRRKVDQHCIFRMRNQLSEMLSWSPEYLVRRKILSGRRSTGKNNDTPCSMKYFSAGFNFCDLAFFAGFSRFTKKRIILFFC